MPRTKEPNPIGVLLSEDLVHRPFEDRVWLMEKLIENVKAEALLQKEQGEKASVILKQIEGNGK